MELKDKTLIKITLGFDVLTGATMKSITFWDVMPSSLVKGGTHCVYFQARRVNQASNQQDTGSMYMSARLSHLAGSFFGLFLDI
jgi:hypothetical protein